MKPPTFWMLSISRSQLRKPNESNFIEITFYTLQTNFPLFEKKKRLLSTETARLNANEGSSALAYRSTFHALIHIYYTSKRNYVRSVVNYIRGTYLQPQEITSKN